MRRAALVIITILVTPSLFAAAWKLEVQGARALGSAYAGSAALARDGSTVWFNPAGMLLLRDTTITAAAPTINLEIEYHDSGASRGLGGLPLSGPRVQDAGTIVAVPHAYWVRPMSDRLAIGFGFNTPYGLGTDYRRQWVGRYQAVETQLLVYNLNPSVAFAVTDTLSVGGGVNFQYANGKLSTAIDFGTIGAGAGIPGLLPQQNDGFVEIRGNDWDVGWNAGVLWHPSERTRLGVSYRAETSADIEGPARFDVPAAAVPLTLGGAFVRTEAATSLPMPESWAFGAYHRVTPRLALLADATRTRWSTHETLNVTFDNPAQPPITQTANWKDAWRFSVGAEFELSDRLTLRGGIADETTPVPDATREPRIPEADHLWLAAGATWAFSQRLDIDFFLLHLETDDAPLTVSSPFAGTLSGNAQWNIWTFGVGATLKW